MDHFEDSSSTWTERYNMMKERHGLTNRDVARITGLSESTIRSSIIRVTDQLESGRRRFPPWLKLAIIIDEKKLNP